MMEGLKEFGGLDIPEDLTSIEANDYLKKACKEADVNCPPPQTTARLLDKVMVILFMVLILEDGCLFCEYPCHVMGKQIR